MNIYQKLNTARAKFHAADIKKTGHNKFAGYKYFELADFIVPALNIFDEVGLTSIISFGIESATMTIINVENPEERIVISSPMSTAALKGCHEVQNLGAVETYIRRYLWVAALEVVEHDALDSSEPVKEEPKVIPSKLTPKPEPKKPITGEKGQFQIVMSAKPEGDTTEWLKLVRDASHILLDTCSSDEDVMTIFKKNKVLFDEVKAEDAVFFKEMMVKFTETKAKFKE